MIKFKNYIFKRLNERSFWIGVGLAVSAAAILPAPWSYLSFVAGVIGSLVPDGKMTDAQ
jgi:hypothetical protein